MPACFALVALTALAAGKFTIVIGGKITAEDAVDDKAGKMVSAKAVADLARASGASMTLDADAGVVSITHDGGAVADDLSGFKAASVTFVIDGKITKAPAKLVAGVPYLGAKDLKKIAEALGFKADLDGAVLALTGGKSGGQTAAATAEPTREPSYGLNGTFMKSVAGGSGLAAKNAAHPGSGGGGDVCAYLDRMKSLWCETEPSAEEKQIFEREAKLFEDNKKKVQAGQKVKGNPADLKLLEDTLKEFNEKVQKRRSGTKDSKPPAGAEEWYQVSNDFLDRYDQAIRLCFQLIDIYKAPPDKQKSREEIEKMHKRLQSLNTQIQGIGAQETELVVRVREEKGCGSANCGE